MNDKKTQRKNKTNLIVNWPSDNEYFTIDDMKKLNPNFVDITLRVRLKKSEEDKSIILIGTKNGGKGRPKSIFSMMPAKSSTIEKAQKDGVVLIENLNVPVLSISDSNTIKELNIEPKEETLKEKLEEVMV